MAIRKLRKTLVIINTKFRSAAIRPWRSTTFHSHPAQFTSGEERFTCLSNIMPRITKRSVSYVPLKQIAMTFNCADAASPPGGIYIHISRNTFSRIYTRGSRRKCLYGRGVRSFLSRGEAAFGETSASFTACSRKHSPIHAR